MVHVRQHRRQLVQTRLIRLDARLARAIDPRGGPQVLAQGCQRFTLVVADQQGRTQFVADFFGIAQDNTIFLAGMRFVIQIRPIMHDQGVALATFRRGLTGTVQQRLSQLGQSEAFVAVKTPSRLRGGKGRRITGQDARSRGCVVTMAHMFLNQLLKTLLQPFVCVG